MMKKKNPSTGNYNRAQRRIAELKDKLRRNADKRRMEKSYKKPASDKNEHYDWRETLDEKCWDGYEKKGMKTMFGKRYPNCVKKSKKKK